MAKMPDYATSKAEWDGKLPFVYQMGQQTSVNGTVTGNVIVAPCDCEVVEAGYRVTTAATNAAAELNAGVVGALTGRLDAHDLTDVAAGFYTVPLSAFTSVNYSKGDAIAMSVVNADTTGVHAAYMVLMPR